VILKLGNLTVKRFAEIVGADFTEEEVALLEAYRVDLASSKDPATFHIFQDPAISIHIGEDAMAATMPTWTAANERKPFNREIGFYPL
jgi:hypothetical protein